MRPQRVNCIRVLTPTGRWYSQDANMDGLARCNEYALCPTSTMQAVCFEARTEAC